MPSVPGSSAAGGTGIEWVAAMAEAAAKTLVRDGEPAFVCHHILETKSQVLFLCALHPRLGLQCGECVSRHITRHTRHDPEEEFRCDRCRSQSDAMVAISQDFYTVGLAIHDIEGRRAKYVGPIFVSGVALCQHALRNLRAVAPRRRNKRTEF